MRRLLPVSMPAVVAVVIVLLLTAGPMARQGVGPSPNRNVQGFWQVNEALQAWSRTVVDRHLAPVCRSTKDAVLLTAAHPLVQNPTEGATSTAEVVAAVDRGWAQAYQTCNVTAVSNLVADDLVFIHSSGTSEDKTAHLASVARCPLEVVTTDVTRIRVYGNDTAVVIGTMSGKVRGRDSMFSQLYTRVYIKQMGAWRLVSHHASDVPKKQVK